MEKNARFPADSPDFRNGLNCPDLIIGIHHRYNRGVRGNGFLYLLGSDVPLAVYRKISNPAALPLQMLAGVQNGMMLKIGGDNVIFSFGFQRFYCTFQCPVVRFCAAPGKINLGGLRIQRRCHLAACFLNGFPGIPANGIDTGRIAVMLLQKREHRPQYMIADLGCSRIVRINKPFHMA